MDMYLASSPGILSPELAAQHPHGRDSRHPFAVGPCRAALPAVVADNDRRSMLTRLVGVANGRGAVAFIACPQAHFLESTSSPTHTHTLLIQPTSAVEHAHSFRLYNPRANHLHFCVSFQLPTTCPPATGSPPDLRDVYSTLNVPATCQATTGPRPLTVSY